MTDNRDSLEGWTKQASDSAEQHGTLLIGTRHSAEGRDEEAVLVTRGSRQVAFVLKGEVLVLDAVELRAAMRRP